LEPSLYKHMSQGYTQRCRSWN